MYAAVYARVFRSADDMTLRNEYRTEWEAEQAAEELRKRGYQTVVKVVERGRFREGVYEGAEGSRSRPPIG